jgi:hypothetical protein
MKFIYVVNLADYRAAGKLYRRRKPLLRFVRFFTLWCIPLIGFWLILWTIRKMLSSGQKPSIVELLLFQAVLFSPLLWEYYKTRKSFGLLRSKIGNGVTIVVDKNGMIAAWEGKKEQTLSWDHIVNFDSDGRIALFSMQKESFFFPMQMLSPAQRAELNDLVARHVVKR